MWGLPATHGARFTRPHTGVALASPAAAAGSVCVGLLDEHMVGAGAARELRVAGRAAASRRCWLAAPHDQGQGCCRGGMTGSAKHSQVVLMCVSARCPSRFDEGQTVQGVSCYSVCTGIALHATACVPALHGVATALYWHIPQNSANNIYDKAVPYE